MTLSKAVATRIRQILGQKNFTQYKLEQISGISHGTMNTFLNNRYSACNLKTVVLIIRALDMKVSEFFDDPIFESDNIDLD